MDKDKKENIVKGMKKNKEDFKDRYGDRWKSVIYATATKMAKESYMESNLQEETISVSDFDSLKKGDRVTIEYGSAMSDGKATFVVKSRSKSKKYNVEKITLVNEKRPGGVKNFLYKRDNKVSFAQGDMGSNVKSFVKEACDGRKFHQLLKKDNSVKHDRRFKFYRGKTDTTASLGTDQVDDVSSDETEVSEGTLYESNIDTLKNIVKSKSADRVKFKDGKSMNVDVQTANTIVKVYDALNDANQKKVALMLDKSDTHFMKMLDFAFSKSK